jgi:hypothetical protein
LYTSLPISKGEQALNIQIGCANALANDAGGSFHIAQILCHEICLNDGVTESSDQKIAIVASIESVKGRVLTELSRTFLERAVEFARGRRFRREGRAPYMHLLHRLATSEDWTCSIESPRLISMLSKSGQYPRLTNAAPVLTAPQRSSPSLAWPIRAKSRRALPERYLH